MLRLLSALLVALALAPPPAAQGFPFPDDRFRQLEELLPTPNAYRTASGAPGHGYWQQRADYTIEVELDDERQQLTGSERIVYHNHSPDALRYLWVQLDNNIFAQDSAGARAATAPEMDEVPYGTVIRMLEQRSFDGAVRVTRLAGADGAPLPHRIVGTMLRIDLDTPLTPGESFAFEIDWNYAINDATRIRARTGYEYFEKDGNYIYEIAHWFPRMAAYTDVNGWQHKQFLGRGEFTLELGDYDVTITVPADHVVAATGVLQNPEEVLSAEQQARLKRAETADELVFVVTPEEAKANEKSRARGTKRWRFVADNVRDFAFASSRKFIWDAWGHRIGDQTVMAMSAYPNEAEPLWSMYSTHAIIHTLDVYGRYTFEYPYPVSWSINGPVGGMEYPMITFNGPRTEDDGTYTDQSRDNEDGKYWNRSKYGLISVIIHEIGHNFFPMIVNSDERQWTWMDEGLNTFLQFLTEQEWEQEYPSRSGFPKDIVEYMTSERQVPIMTNSESLLQFGNNAYSKPATALNILRQTILGPELFDEAFREYAQRWKFKRPMPADLFRTMEDASSIDLDWFWRGWFYTTDHVDIGIDKVTLYTLDSRDPEVEKPRLRQEEEEQPENATERYYADKPKRADRYPELKDFYNSFDEFAVTARDREKFEELLADLEPKERKALQADLRFYVVELRNDGGLVMPVILRISYADGEQEELRIPAEIWRRDWKKARKMLLSETEITRIELDPWLETADADLSDNSWPAEPVKSRFKLFKEKKEKNAMQEAAEEGKR